MRVLRVNLKIPSVYFDAAKELGRLLGERKLRVVNGAGNIGLMCAVSDAALAAGGTVTGVIPILWWSRIGIIKA